MDGPIDLEQIFRAHQKEVFVYLLRTVGNRQLAEDLAQETFERACTAALTFRGASSVRTWLFSIARRTLADHYRRRAPELLEDPPEQTAAAAIAERLDIERALESLPVVGRESVILCDLFGFSPTEAAAITGVTANAFRVRLHRARQQFREAYGRDE